MIAGHLLAMSPQTFLGQILKGTTWVAQPPTLLLGHIVEEAAECGRHERTRLYSTSGGLSMDAQRASRYERLTEQLRGLIENKSPTLEAAMSTICAVLHAKMRHHSWTGFYHFVGEDELHIGPYQGPVSCQILKGSGVCLHAASTGESVVVADIHAFPGHIACDSRSKSEIVLPLFKGSRVVAVLDIDSAELDQFSEADIEPLAKILELLPPYL